MTAHERHDDALTSALASLLTSGAVFSCPACRGRWIVRPDGPAVLFHRCHAAQRRGFDWRTPRQYVDEERRAWAERALGANPFTTALEDELGDQALRGEEE